ncbi:Eukaryotic initiation factor 4E family protein [Trichomonas vaginalis G3]|uniref:Eukaryotic initiation factor 4E family protein n=1 Tax=Trichomonas vaginalis (strain ATCC PRA-98 / G3) TaxID=412133 RepID=A2F040_TRIV3|nr:translation initiation factor protein [Trichomonas vaginalis G3]EAY01742.1 Eukaryotic initiation factor 4E family protein [Trichomonas vaginalis G3]KAI5532807.1 translation initiation factor protein [Trichomonas vaginalis G3]|eukprot:XP_001314300.1 Eukaryotic initiation factor 4E family protein [Trichomonas vaginalis G3]
MSIEKDGTLYREWTLWYLIPDRYTMKEAAWKDFLHPIADFDTIDKFWAAFNSIEKASLLPKGCRYYVFRKGILPLWEDHANISGHEVSIEHTIAKAKKPKVNDRWEDVLFSVIGESFPYSDKINGVEFTVRTETFKIGVWVSQTPYEVTNAISAELAKLIRWNTPVKVSEIKI